LRRILTARPIIWFTELVLSILPPFTPDQLQQLPHVLSTQRFATYLQARSHDRTHALTLYLWNIKISSAFLVPLHVLEVTLRNAIVEAIKGVHGDTWPWSEGFTRSLPDSPARNYSAKRDLQGCSRKHQTAGKIIADLNSSSGRRCSPPGIRRAYGTIPSTPCFPTHHRFQMAHLRTVPICARISKRSGNYVTGSRTTSLSSPVCSGLILTGWFVLFVGAVTLQLTGFSGLILSLRCSRKCLNILRLENSV